MKVRITSKEIRSNFPKSRIFFGNRIENEIKYFFGEADWYNCGVMGWNYDAYNFGTFTVIFGYRSFPASVNLPDYIIEYMRAARDFARSFTWTEYEKERAYIAAVRESFREMIVDYLNGMKKDVNEIAVQMELNDILTATAKKAAVTA